MPREMRILPNGNTICVDSEKAGKIDFNAPPSPEVKARIDNIVEKLRQGGPNAVYDKLEESEEAHMVARLIEPGVPLYKDTTKYQQGNLPLIISDLTLTKDVNGRPIVTFYMTATCKESIRAMLFNIKCYSIWGEALEGVNNFQILDLITKENEKVESPLSIYMPDANTRKVSISVEKVAIEDGNVINRTLNITAVVDDIPKRLNFKCTKCGGLSTGWYNTCPKCAAVNTIVRIR